MQVLQFLFLGGGKGPGQGQGGGHEEGVGLQMLMQMLTTAGGPAPGSNAFGCRPGPSTRGCLLCMHGQRSLGQQHLPCWAATRAASCLKSTTPAHRPPALGHSPAAGSEMRAAPRLGRLAVLGGRGRAPDMLRGAGRQLHTTAVTQPMYPAIDKLAASLSMPL